MKDEKEQKNKIKCTRNDKITTNNLTWVQGLGIKRMGIKKAR